MKNITLLILTTLFLSCQQQDCTDGIQNGNETGVDCGGNCPACPTCFDGIQNGTETGVDCGGTICPACNTNTNSNNGSTNATLLAIQGLWEFNAKLQTSNSIMPWVGGAAPNVLYINTGSLCKLELTNIVTFPGSPPAILTQYSMLGLPGFCQYPQNYVYTFDPTTDALSPSYHVDNVTNDSLLLSKTGSNYNEVAYYSKLPLLAANASSVNWTVELTSSYAGNNQVGILIEYGPSLFDTVYVNTGQTLYSGNKIVNLASSYPSFSIKLINLDFPNPSYNIISFNTELEVVGTPFISKTGPHSLCHSWTGHASCIGYDAIGSQPANLNQITWNGL